MHNVNSKYNAETTFTNIQKGMNYHKHLKYNKNIRKIPFDLNIKLQEMCKLLSNKISLSMQIFSYVACVNM